MTKIHRVDNHSFSYLSELNRKDLVIKSVRHSPERVQRSKDYKITGKMEVDVDEFINKDIVIVEIPVNEYICTLEFTNLLETLIKVVDKQHRGNVNLDSVTKAIRVALDDEQNLKINCTCPDFYYRFSYVATRNGYKNGKRQQIPASIRNPHDSLGSCCKHLLMILKNKQWVRKFASVINYLVKEYYYDILQMYDLDATHFFINISGRNNPKYVGVHPHQGRSKLDKSKFYDTDEDEEELELNT